MYWNIAAAVVYVHTTLITICNCRLPIPRVLLISFDGFRWDYLQKAETPNFDRIVRSGVYAKRGIKNVFTTKTFPNHHTIATGLYTENHGIVGDVFYDPEYMEIFNGYDKTRAMDPKWYKNGGEPIWITNQKNNTERRSGCLFWPLCGPSINDVTPYRHMFYDPDMPNRTQIDTLITWFTDKLPINLGLLYFDEPDATGHIHGPDSKEMKGVIQHLDDIIGYLLDELEHKGLFDTMHIIVTSDHGMSKLSNNKVIDLNDYIDRSWYRMFTKYPIADILPNTGKEEIIYEALKNVSHLKIYHKEEIPDRYHYKHHRRVQPLLLVPEKGYTIVHGNYSIHAGDHGYDNDIADMHPFFVAMGPMFIGGRYVDTFNIVDIYPMLCYILHLQPASNNGSLENVRFLLREEEIIQSTFVVYIIAPLFIVTVFSGVFIWSWRRRNSVTDGSLCAQVPLLQQNEEDDEDIEEDEV